MAWVVDTCVLIDIAQMNSIRRTDAMRCLQSRAADGLCICPVTFTELAPRFFGDVAAAELFLQTLQVSLAELWIHDDTLVSFRLWHDLQLRRRSGTVMKRPIADVLIAAFASRFQELISSNASDFRTIQPTLPIIAP